MEDKGLIEDSGLQIAICDDDKGDRERVYALVQNSFI